MSITLFLTTCSPKALTYLMLKPVALQGLPTSAILWQPITPLYPDFSDFSLSGLYPRPLFPSLFPFLSLFSPKYIPPKFFYANSGNHGFFKKTTVDIVTSPTNLSRPWLLFCFFMDSHEKVIGMLSSDVLLLPYDFLIKS